MRPWFCSNSLIAAAVLLFVPAWPDRGPVASTSLRFEVTIPQGTITSPISGRLFVVASRKPVPEPRMLIGQTGMDAAVVLGRDVANLVAGEAASIGHGAAAFPIQNLDQLPAGEYYAQAVLQSNIDLKSVDAAGNLYSSVERVRLDAASNSVVRFQLDRVGPPEELPGETEFVKWVKIQSSLLSRFHGRPIYLRAGVILPKDFEKEPARKYPIRVEIGGYGARYTAARRLMVESDFRTAWLANDAPRMVLLYLDGDGPFGDPYQINSDNNGPYGDAITQELIPYVEKKFRCIGEPWARVLTGGSTGGWVSLALQVFYPDYFNGTWSGFPDGVDFRGFQLINIYEDENAYVNRYGFERPSARTLDGDTKFTVRHECQMENVLGLGDSWTMSGEQWGAWNATYGPRGANGRPAPLWDPKSGKIDRGVVEHWKKYDLRLVMQQNWKTLGPRLRGKIHVWVGEADEYFLNNAVHLLDKFLTQADPAYEGWIRYGPGQGHGWMPFDERELMRQMAEAVRDRR